jgi:hypothetical protein
MDGKRGMEAGTPDESVEYPDYFQTVPKMADGERSAQT